MNNNNKLPQDFKPEITFIKICLILICVFSFTTCTYTCSIEKNMRMMRVY